LFLQETAPSPTPSAASPLARRKPQRNAAEAWATRLQQQNNIQDPLEGGSVSPTVSRPPALSGEETRRPSMLKSNAAALASAPEQEAQSQKCSIETLCGKCITALTFKKQCRTVSGWNQSSTAGLPLQSSPRLSQGSRSLPPPSTARLNSNGVRLTQYLSRRLNTRHHKETITISPFPSTSS